MQNRRLSAILVTSVLTIALSSCAPSNYDAMDLYAKPDIENKTIAAIMQEELNEKYDNFFIVQDLEEQTGRTAFDKTLYVAKVSSLNSKEEFDASMYSNGDELKDTYSKVLYNDTIDKLVYDIIYNRSDNYIYDYEIVYVETDKKYTTDEELELYLTETDTYIDINVDVQDTNIDSVAKKLYEISLAFKDKKLHFSIRVSLNDKSFYIIDDNYVSLLSYDELVDKLIK